MEYPHKGNTCVREYMTSVIEDHRDNNTDEINTTTLAEDACAYFDAYDGDDIPQRFFDCAVDVDLAVNAATRPLHCLFGGLVNAMNSDFSLNIAR